MNKSKLTLSIIAIALLASVRSAFAAGPSVSIVKLPEYMKTDNFAISYSTLAPAGLKNVTIQFHKEGDSWQTLDIFTTNADQVSVSGHIGSDATYYFSATACDNSDVCNTDYTQTKIDRVAPPKPEGFGKSRTSDHNYHLLWHNADSDDLYQVYVYRSTTAGFTADSGTQVATINVTKNTDTNFDNAVPADGKDYFYLARSVDRAGNASDVVGDFLVNSTTVSSAPTGAPASGNESFQGQKLALSPSVLGAKAEITPEPTAVVIPSPTTAPETALSTQVNEIAKAVKKTSPIWPIFGFAAFAVVIYWFVSKKK